MKLLNINNILFYICHPLQVIFVHEDDNAKFRFEMVYCISCLHFDPLTAKYDYRCLLFVILAD